MGWLFGKKKEPQVPFPPARLLEEGALRFNRRSSEQIIGSEEIKAAAGVEKAFSFPEETEETPTLPGAPAITTPLKENGGPVFIKVDVYQQILGEIEGIKAQLNEVGEGNRKLETSEYNEQNNFTNLRREMKMVHDHLLQIDALIFKTKGE